MSEVVPGRGVSARVLIVDDEPVARRGLRRALSKIDRIGAIAECANGVEAVAAITADPPQLVVLDVQMPGLDGLEVVRRVGADAMPPAVFVTAHDAYAVRAFELAAVDYVLKPYTEGRVRAAVERGLDRLAERGAAKTLHRLLAAIGEAPAAVVGLADGRRISPPHSGHGGTARRRDPCRRHSVGERG